MKRNTFQIKRQTLLVEIERRCPSCKERVRVGLTKAEAREYRGFTCARCENFSHDQLSERDVPEWWEDLMIRSLDEAVRSRSHDETGRFNTLDDAGAAGETSVERLSSAYRQISDALAADDPETEGVCPTPRVGKSGGVNRSNAGDE